MENFPSYTQLSCWSLLPLCLFIFRVEEEIFHTVCARWQIASVFLWRFETLLLGCCCCCLDCTKKVEHWRVRFHPFKTFHFTGALGVRCSLAYHVPSPPFSPLHPSSLFSLPCSFVVSLSLFHFCSFFSALCGSCPPSSFSFLSSCFSLFYPLSSLLSPLFPPFFLITVMHMTLYSLWN